MQTFGYFFTKNRIYSIILCPRMALDACIRKTSFDIKRGFILFVKKHPPLHISRTMRLYFRREPTLVGGPKLLQIKIALLAPNCLTCEKTPAFAYIPHNADVLQLYSRSCIDQNTGDSRVIVG